MPRPDPISKEELDEIELSRDEMLALSLVESVRNDQGDREAWLNKTNLMHRKRYGVKRAKTFPWPNASNINIPMVDKTIRRLKPGFINMIFGSKPIAAFEPVSGEDIENARSAEQFFDWLVRTSIDNFFKSTVRGIDWMLESGFFNFKITWDHKTRVVHDRFEFNDLSEEEKAFILSPETTMEAKVGLYSAKTDLALDNEDDFNLLQDIIERFMNGETVIKIEREEVVCDKPKVTAIKPQDLIVPADTTDISTSRRVTHKMFLTKNDLLMKQRSGVYSGVEHVQPVNKINKSDQIETVKEAREGVRDVHDAEDLIEVWEIYSWQKPTGVEEDSSTPAVPTVMTLDPNSMTVLRFMELPYEHGMWPFVQIRFEENDDRYHSARGVPEILDDVATEINAQHNAKLDRMTIANAPMLLIRSSSNVTGKNIRFIPGQTLRTQRPAEDVLPFQFPILDASFQTEEQILKSWGEEYIGDPAFGLSGINNALGESRTATEVSAIEQNANLIFSLDGRIVQEGMKRVYDQLWALWNQFGPDETWIRTMNSEPINMSRDEIQGRFDIKPVGTSDNSNPVLETQKALARLQLLAGNPLIRQRELLTDYLEKDDRRLAQRLVKTEQELLNEQRQAQAQQQAPTVDQAIQALNQQKNNGAQAVTL